MKESKFTLWISPLLGQDSGKQHLGYQGCILRVSFPTKKDVEVAVWNEGRTCDDVRAPADELGE
jgi:hypothetical protein